MPLQSYIMRRDLLCLQGTWRSLPEYQPYFDIIESMPEATQAEKEIRVVLDKRFPKKFFEIALNTFDSNFDQWRQENLQLALGGDELPARYLANWVLGKPNPSDTSYESEAHDTTIDLDDAILYLTGKATPAELKSRRFFVQHSAAVEKISTGGSIWRDESLSEFRQFVESKWVALPSNTQFVEGGVKDSKRCASTSRSEELRSLIAIQRSQMVHRVHEGAKEKREYRMLRANQHVTSGKPGQRKRKLKTGGLEHETLGRKKIRAEVTGAVRTTEIIKSAFETSTKAQQISPADREELTRRVFSKDNQFQHQRVSVKVERFANKRDTNKPPNAIQRQNLGMDLTPLMKGQIPYSKITITLQKDNVIKELRYRLGEAFPAELERQGIKRLVAVLRDDEEKRTKNKEQDGFVPLFLELDQWGVKFGKRRQA
jgi:hypothetical protein